MSSPPPSAPDPSPLRRLALALDAALTTLAAVAVGLFTLVVVYVAIGRYAFGSTPYWSEELPRSLLVWSVFLGLPSVTWRAAHLNAGLLPLLTGEGAARRGLETLARLASAAFYLVLGVVGLQFAHAGMDSLTTALQIPSAVVYAALPLGALLAALAALLPPEGAS